MNSIQITVFFVLVVRTSRGQMNLALQYNRKNFERFSNKGSAAEGSANQGTAVAGEWMLCTI
jgi:hypothetical protein